MSDEKGLLHEVASRAGIATSYRNQFNQSITLNDETIRAVLESLGLETEGTARLEESLNKLDALRMGLIPRLLPVQAQQMAFIPLREAICNSLTYRLTAEDGMVFEGRTDVSFVNGQPHFEIAPLPAGYYQFEIHAGGKTAQALIVSAPALCYMPEDFDGQTRGFGLTAQIYGLNSARNFGIGDFTDIANLATKSARFGASFVGLSPVHALFSADRTKISPYSPSSRLFIDPVFIDPRRIEGYEGSKAALIFNEPATQRALEDLRSGAFIDHAAAWSMKLRLLEPLWDDFCLRHTPEFETFRHAGREQLQLHATFESLSAKFFKEDRYWLGEWPEEYKNANSEAVQRYQHEAAHNIAFHVWLQWVADTQMAAAQSEALGAGMHVGLYRDLAVGADGFGSEVWAHPERFAGQLSIGSPPDPLATLGQNWGLPPFNPFELETQGLAAFRALVSTNMRHAGAIRIDHAFQLQRLYLIPAGMPASAGAYVSYPLHAMLAVLRLESHRARSMVIAEDLGNAPEGFSETIMQAGVLSYRLLSFERQRDGRFIPPNAYPRGALAAFTTHDLPTFLGWKRGLDIDLRETFGIFDKETADSERLARQKELRFFSEALKQQGLISSENNGEGPPLEATIRYLGRTNSVLVAVQMEDAAGEINQANLPGPDVGHPNWRRRLAEDLDEILVPGGPFAKIASLLAEEGRRISPYRSRLAMPPPRATYRLQFHSGFNFEDAARCAPYLARLGISHVYASPIQKARPGSTHGYDTIDHGEINPELGGKEGFFRFSETLRDNGLDLILDIVPNHMGVGGADNHAWLSVLEWGEASPFADTFDIDWERLGAHHKLVLPFLGGHYGEILEKGELQLCFSPDDGSFNIAYHEHRFPISPLTYPDILDRAMAAESDPDGRGVAQLSRIGEELRSLAQEPNPRIDLVAACEALKTRLAALAQQSGITTSIDHAIKLFNGVPNRSESFNALHRLLERQAYRLSYWRIASSDINYRRFFDIDTLAGVRIERPEVFARVHRLVFDLIGQNLVQGLRIDHIDGLANPKAYIEALQRTAGPGFYLVAEKILEPGETLRPWSLAGTTGYDVLNLIDNILVDPASEPVFDQIYADFLGYACNYETALENSKRQVLQMSFSSELESLVSDLKRIADAGRRTRDFTANAIRSALSDIITAFPVYRTYVAPGEVAEKDKELVRGVITKAKAITSLPDRGIHDFAGEALLLSLKTDGPGEPRRTLVERFSRKFQQLTGPVMAKSLEDTLFYNYVRFLALNEVGGEPSRFGVDIEAFHASNKAQADAWPNALIASATHDTKRGEDSRARLLSLSGTPDLWQQALKIWQETLACDNAAMPDNNDQYLILQSILGAWPIELTDGNDEAELTLFSERIQAFVTKALRESKRHSKWIEPNEAYEAGALSMAAKLLSPGSEFFRLIQPIVAQLSYQGLLNSLVKVILKCTLPGVPDIYQGTELWDFSLVDPDNRRPVDFEKRNSMLNDERPIEELLLDWQTGAIKQRLLRRLLSDRREKPLFYAEANYEPLYARGEQKNHVLAFRRTLREETLITVLPRLTFRKAPPLSLEFWRDTEIAIGGYRWFDVLAMAERELPENVRIGDLFSNVPFAVLRTSL